MRPTKYPQFCHLLTAAIGLLCASSCALASQVRLEAMSQVGQPTLPRFGHSQVWTGNNLVVWGGAFYEQVDEFFYELRSAYADGGIYDPVTNSWSSMSQVGAPSPRYGHSAVWTGTEMIVWGGYKFESIEIPGNDEFIAILGVTDGAIYNPTTNTWRPMPAAPSALQDQSAVWTGTEMIIWGLAEYTATTGSGMAYNPQTNTWRLISSSGSPSARIGQGTVWTGDAMVIWGGTDSWFLGGNQLAVGTGAFYYPSTDTWVPISTVGAPPGGAAGDGEAAQLLWTGSKLIATLIYAYDQVNNRWLQETGLYDPATSSWENHSPSGAPDAPIYMTVWNGERLFLLGSSFDDFAAYAYDFTSRQLTEVVSATTGSFQGRVGTWVPALGELLIFGGTWLDGGSSFGGGPEAQKGLRLVLGSVDKAPSLTDFRAAGGWQAYLAANIDVFQAGYHDEASAYTHWRDSGSNEDRLFDAGRLRSDLPDGVTDPQYAIDGGFAWEYPDQNGRKGNTMVFITKDAPKPIGWDGRALLLEKGDLFNLGPDYTANAYRAINIDVANAIDSGNVPSFASVTDHYVKYGFKEGRLTNDSWIRAQLDAWNDEAYLNANPDVRTFFFGAQSEGWKLFGKVGFAHYINFGQREGRGTGQ